MLHELGNGRQRYRLLLISPHPDDEAIFFGGTLATYARRGVDVRVLHLTTGCSNFTGVSEPGRNEVLRLGDLSEIAQRQIIEMRRKEGEDAAQILGVRSIKCLPFASRSLDTFARAIIQQQIEVFDPHVVLSLSEAGTTAHRDHSWSALLTDQAIQAIIEEQWSEHTSGRTWARRPPFAFRRYFTYTLPGLEQWLQKWSEMVVPEAEMTRINVRAVVEYKRKAALAYKTQQHLIAFFDRIELLQLPQECYYERICLGRSVRGMTDLFGAWDEEPECIRYGPMPEKRERYKFSAPSWSEQFWNVVREGMKNHVSLLEPVDPATVSS